jgi:hypothetical protein
VAAVFIKAYSRVDQSLQSRLRCSVRMGLNAQMGKLVWRLIRESFSIARSTSHSLCKQRRRYLKLLPTGGQATTAREARSAYDRLALYRSCLKQPVYVPLSVMTLVKAASTDDNWVTSPALHCLAPLFPKQGEVGASVNARALVSSDVAGTQVEVRSD